MGHVIGIDTTRSDSEKQTSTNASNFEKNRREDCGCTFNTKGELVYIKKGCTIHFHQFLHIKKDGKDE